MIANYGYIGLFVIVAIFFTATMMLIPVVLRFLKVVPHKPNPIKNATYECGMNTIGKSWVQFNFRYYFFALVFLVLDVLVVFLYPWAASFRELGIFGFAVILILIFIVLIGYVYAWKKRVLEWK